MEHCPQCNTMVSVEVLGAYLKCETCGMRFPRPRKKRGRVAPMPSDDGGELGIHPALARRYQKPGSPGAGAPGELTRDEPMPSVQLSPSLVEEAKRRRANGPSTPAPPAPPAAQEEAPTAVESKPGALATGEGSVAPAEDEGARHRESTRPLRPSFEKPSTPHGDDDDDDDDRVSTRDTPLERRAARTSKPREPMPVLPGLAMIEQVGKGAMGRVCKARDEETGDDVAVKLLAPELAARPDFVARFEREGAALARVSHPGVVAIRGSGSHGEHHYLVMEFVDGVSLRRILDGGPLTPGRALAFARQIVQGLGAAHEKSVIHRDLKPENILVERVRRDDGEVEERLVLVDFGLAGIIDEGEDPHPNLTKSRMTMGTVNYMAPEQRTDAKRVDQRADLYAAGVILYELLTGDLPLGRFALPRERGLPLPESVDDCIHKALARRAEERFQTAAQLDQALAKIESELSRAASMDTLVGRSQLLDSEASLEADEDSLDEELAGSVRSLAPRVPEDVSTASGRNAQWHTAPPWVKRPELLWGVLALAVGAGAGLYLAQEEPPPTVAAPALVVEASADGARVSFASSASASWLPSGEGWSASGVLVRFEGEGATPTEPALLSSPEPLAAAAVEARFLVDVAADEPSADDSASGYAGVMWKTADGMLVGVLRFADGTCGVLELDDTVARVSPFRCPTTPGPMEVGIACTRADGRCLVDAGGAAEAEYQAKLGAGPLSLSLACAGRRCSFTSTAGAPRTQVPANAATPTAPPSEAREPDAP